MLEDQNQRFKGNNSTFVTSSFGYRFRDVPITALYKERDRACFWVTLNKKSVVVHGGHGFVQTLLCQVFFVTRTCRTLFFLFLQLVNSSFAMPSFGYLFLGVPIPGLYKQRDTTCFWITLNKNSDVVHGGHSFVQKKLLCQVFSVTRTCGTLFLSFFSL